MANVRMTKKIKETISQYNAKIIAEKFATVNAIAKNSELAKTIVGWMDYNKHVENNCVNFSAYNYDDWDSAITFYCGKKPKDLDNCYYQGSVKVSKEMLEFLKNYNENDLAAKKEMNEWWNGLQDKANKKEQSKNKEKVAKLDFDGEITLKEIREQYKDLYIKMKKSKLSFHKRTDAHHYSSVPEFTIKIKPVNYYEELYNKAEFEEAIKHAVKTIEVPEDLIKYALSFGVTINANKRNGFELRYSYDGTNNRWYTAYKAILPGNATKTGIKKAIKTFGEKRADRIHQYLRQHNIDADSDHYEQIKHLLDDTVVLYGIVQNTA